MHGDGRVILNTISVQYQDANITIRLFCLNIIFKYIPQIGLDFAFFLKELSTLYIVRHSSVNLLFQISSNVRAAMPSVNWIAATKLGSILA